MSPRNTRKDAEGLLASVSDFGFRISNLAYAAVLGGLLFTSIVSAAEAPEVVVRASVEPEKAWVGERVRLRVDVLGRDGWASIGKVRDFEVPGVYVVNTGGQGVRLQETIQGQSYSGQQQEVSLFPRRSGTIEVPAIPVDVVVRTFGAAGTAVTHRVESPAVTFEVLLPPGAEGTQELVSSSDLTALQAWAPEQETFMVGDAIERTVTFEADGVSGMAFAPLNHEPIPGVGIYPEQPEVEDRTDRGALKGRRTESVSYVFESQGQVTLPDVALTWFDLGSGTLKTEKLDGLVLDIAPNPEAAVAGGTAVGPSSRSRAWSLLALVAALAIGVLWCLRRRLAEAWTRWCMARRESEAAYFARFHKAARSNDPVASYNALMQWLDHGNTGSSVPLLGLCADLGGGEEARREVERLWQAVEAGPAVSWDGRNLDRVMKICRRTQRGLEREGEGGRSALPPLNPGRGERR